MQKDRHVIEALGKTEIIIEDGRIISIDEPKIDYCPIFAKYHNIQHITVDDIRKNIEYRIEDFGMCTKNRQLRMKDMLSVGISEILRSNLKLGNIDCVVGACDGIGTLLMDDADLVQGVGGRVSGLVSTTPIPELIEEVGKENVLNPLTAELNQLKGLEMAIDKGYKNIAVTVIPSPMIKEIREYPIPDDVNVYIFVAHTTGISEKLAAIAFDYADIVTACASREVINLAQERKPYYYGTAVPIFAVSVEGRKFLDARLTDVGKNPSINEYPLDEDNFARKLL
ncbi:MAG: DUF2099 family protein [Methanosphaera sp.]|nr:DUF2099 family protein [Methanosphaera sp.]